jgi:rubredoxin
MIIESEREQELNRADALADLDAGVDTDGPELVGEAWACPECGNRVMDELVWSMNGGFVMCAGCGFIFDPEATA